MKQGNVVGSSMFPGDVGIKDTLGAIPHSALSLRSSLMPFSHVKHLGTIARLFFVYMYVSI